MLERIAHNNGLVTYQSPMLRGMGIRHGFTTRLGGASKPPYDALNLGPLTKGVGDANMAISENFRRVRTALGLERVPRYEVRQVHEAGVWDAPPKPVAWTQAVCADAIYADTPGKLLCIRVADCVPILLASADGRRVAAVHAGWRGLVAGVIEAAAARFADEVFAVVGPCIGVRHFEVGPEVAEQFGQAFVRRDLGAKPHIDLRAAARDRLESAGVAALEIAHNCTYAEDAEFFSHRRDVTHQGKPDTGRMAALIVANG